MNEQKKNKALNWVLRSNQRNDSWDTDWLSAEGKTKKNIENEIRFIEMNGDGDIDKVPSNHLHQIKKVHLANWFEIYCHIKFKHHFRCADELCGWAIYSIEGFSEILLVKYAWDQYCLCFEIVHQIVNFSFNKFISYHSLSLQ